MFSVIESKVRSLLPFLRSSVLYTATAFIVSLLNYYFNLSLARAFSLTDYGEYMTTLSYVLLLSVPIGALTVALIKRIGRTHESERWLVSISIEAWVRSLLWNNKWLLLGVASVTVVLLSVFRLRWESALVVIALWLLATLGAVYPAVFQAGRRFVWVSVLLVLVTLCKISGLWLMPSSQALLFIYGLLVVAGCVQIGIGAWLLRTLARQTKSVSRPQLLKWHLITVLKRKSVYLPALSSLGIMGMMTVDIIVAKMVLPAEQVGLYAGLSLLAKILLYLTGPLTAVAYAFFAGSETKKDSKLILVICVMLFILGSVLVGSIYIFMPAMITSIFLGSSYSLLGSSLWIAAIFGGLYSIATLLTQYLIAHGSRLGLLSLAAVGMQVIGILLFHASLTQVMVVNSVVAFCLCLGYAIGLVKMHNNQSPATNEAN